MRFLMIASGYLPYLFSENLCNGKLAMAFKRAGMDLDVISKIDDGPTYGDQWEEPWKELEPSAYLVQYDVGNKLERMVDAAYSSVLMGVGTTLGIRWIRRAYQIARRLMKENRYDAVLTRSPNDIAHVAGYKLHKETGIKWIANWNDPAAPIWPGEYRHKYSERKQAKSMAFTRKLLLAADVTTFPSDSLRQHFFAHFPELRNRQTAVVPHIGLVGDLWPKPAAKSGNGKLMLLHSGNLSAERNPELTFKAMRKLVDNGFTQFEFHIMGHTSNYTESLISKYRLSEYVKCIGSYPYIEALARMQAYDVLVLLEARLDKGIFFASKFTDYLQSGLPLLAISPTEGFAHDRLSGRKGEYLADNTSEDSIYEALCQIVSCWQDGTLAQSASSYLYKDFSPEHVVGQYRQIIK